MTSSKTNCAHVGSSQQTMRCRQKLEGLSVFSMLFGAITRQKLVLPVVSWELVSKQPIEAIEGGNPVRFSHGGIVEGRVGKVVN